MLSDRQRLILSAIIDNYIRSAEPVGSRTISKREEIGLSSATVRNEMADLEELGYLEQPHTSAGRVPSTKGYRFYVDHLIEPKRLTEQEIANLWQIFADQITKFEQVMEHTATILSQVTNYTSVVLGPEIFEHRLKRLQIIPLSDRQAVAVIVTHTGRVENKLVDIPSAASAQEVEKLVNILNSKLHDVPLWQLRQRLYQEIAQELRKNVEEYEEMMRIVDQALTRDHDKDRVYLRGTTKMLNQPEFRDVGKVKEILELFEQGDQVAHLFAAPTEGLHIRIGQENDLEAVKNCTIITTSYYLDGKPAGTVGIIGPTRMDYRKVIAVLDFLARGLSRMLTEQFDGK